MPEGQVFKTFEFISSFQPRYALADLELFFDSQRDGRNTAGYDRGNSNSHTAGHDGGNGNVHANRHDGGNGNTYANRHDEKYEPGHDGAGRLQRSQRDARDSSGLTAEEKKTVGDWLDKHFADLDNALGRFGARGGKVTSVSEIRPSYPVGFVTEDDLAQMARLGRWPSTGQPFTEEDQKLLEKCWLSFDKLARGGASTHLDAYDIEALQAGVPVTFDSKTDLYTAKIGDKTIQSDGTRVCTETPHTIVFQTGVGEKAGLFTIYKNTDMATFEVTRAGFKAVAQKGADGCWEFEDADKNKIKVRFDASKRKMEMVSDEIETSVSPNHARVNDKLEGTTLELTPIDSSGRQHTKLTSASEGEVIIRKSRDGKSLSAITRDLHELVYSNGFSVTKGKGGDLVITRADTASFPDIKIGADGKLSVAMPDGEIKTARASKDGQTVLVDKNLEVVRGNSGKIYVFFVESGMHKLMVIRPDLTATEVGTKGQDRQVFTSPKH